MEETNYVRRSVDIVRNGEAEVTPGKGDVSDKEKGEPRASSANSTSSGPATPYVKKAFWKKMSLLNFASWLPDTLHHRFWHSLYYLSWPVIVYAG